MRLPFSALIVAGLYLAAALRKPLISDNRMWTASERSLLQGTLAMKLGSRNGAI
jgi:hypothetical protein